MASSRQLVYLSGEKLKANFPGSSRALVLSGNVQASVGPLSLGLTLEQATGDRAQLTREFERVRKDIERQTKSVDDRTLRPLEWFRFDEPLAYGTACEDSAIPDVASDVALFAGTVTSTRPQGGRPIELLLCGSACHLLDRSWESAGRMGSSTGWLYDLIKEIKKLDDAGEQNSGSAVGDRALRLGRSITPEEVARTVFTVFTEHRPSGQRAQLGGIAQLLLDVALPHWPTRLLVATPLYVQPPRATRGRRWWFGPGREPQQAYAG